jgi:hypothetical protein
MKPRFRVVALGSLYAEQKELLDKIHQRDGTDLYVSSFSAVQKSDADDVVSYCVWGEGVDCLLPVTQKVAFMQEGQERPVALGTWSHVMTIAGDLLESTEDYPRRYRARLFPDQAALEAIGAGEM